jgi:hypothetical protein
MRSYRFLNWLDIENVPESPHGGMSLASLPCRRTAETSFYQREGMVFTGILGFET